MNSEFSVFVTYGSNRALSKLELSAILERIELKDVLFLEWKQNMLLNLPENMKGKFLRLLEDTGSIVKAGTIGFCDDVKQEKNWGPALKDLLEKNIKNYYIKTKKQVKITISIQTTSNDLTIRIHRNTQRIINNLSNELDIPVKILKLKNETYEQTPYQYHKENMNRRGFELKGFVIKSKIYFGTTNWITNPLLDIKQDEERKVRYFTHGTSIKLSRSLVFLSQIQKGETLLDPFCGTGTILLQALKQGNDVIGIDKDPKCFRATKENLNQFTMQNPSKDKIKEKWKVFKQDSRYLTSILTDKVGAIVTEPYLGPFLTKLPHEDEAEDIMMDLQNLYTSVLKTCTDFLKQNSKVVIVIPEYRYSTNKIITPDIEQIAKGSSLKIERESTFFSVKLPIAIGRTHNIIGRKLVLFSNTS